MGQLKNIKLHIVTDIKCELVVLFLMWSPKWESYVDWPIIGYSSHMLDLNPPLVAKC